MSSVQERSKQICQNGLKRLAWINIRILQIAEKLKEIQPNKPGAITLSLNGCGKDCYGCPHLVWLSWRLSRRGIDKKYIAKKITRPLLSFRKVKEGFENSHEQTKQLVQEANDLEKERSEITKAIQSLARATKELV